MLYLILAVLASSAVSIIMRHGEGKVKNNFAMFMANKMEEEGFENRVNELLDDFCHTSGAILSEEDRTFLIKETAAYVNTMAHTVYFAYGLGFRRPADFISQKWIPKEDHPVLKEIKNFFLGVEGKGVL